MSNCYPSFQYLLDLLQEDDVRLLKGVHLVLGEHVLLEDFEDLPCVVFGRPSQLLPNDKARQGIGCLNSSYHGLFLGRRAPSAHQDLFSLCFLFEGGRLSDLLRISSLFWGVRFSGHIVWIPVLFTHHVLRILSLFGSAESFWRRNFSNPRLHNLLVQNELFLLDFLLFGNVVLRERRIDVVPIHHIFVVCLLLHLFCWLSLLFCWLRRHCAF